MKRKSVWLWSALISVALLMVTLCSSGRDGQQELAADLYAAGEVALAAGEWDLAVARFRELHDRAPGYRDAEEKLAQAFDGSVVRVPAGAFIMGSDAGDLDERPQRRVTLDAFEIDRYEVTNLQYRRFLLATGREPPTRWPERYVALLPDRDPDWHGTHYPAGEGTHPVVAVNWDDATAYCAWVGKRLPTEAEWEKAARGPSTSSGCPSTSSGCPSTSSGCPSTSSGQGRTYPWGDDWDPGQANVGATGIGYTQPVGSYPGGASPYGALDMAGNAWEWVADLYDRQYYTFAPNRNPPGPESGTGERILRGGAWDSPPDHVRASYRNGTHCFGPNYRAGFRCARSVGP